MPLIAELRLVARDDAATGSLVRVLLSGAAEARVLRALAFCRLLPALETCVADSLAELEAALDRLSMDGGQPLLISRNLYFRYPLQLTSRRKSLMFAVV